MAQQSNPKRQVKHGKQQSNSLSSTVNDLPQSLHYPNSMTASSSGKTPQDHKRLIKAKSKGKNKKNNKMGSLKRWFSRLGNDNKSEEEKAHANIERKIAQQSKMENSTMSMLLLGAGGSGKSTVLKQMDRIHNKEKYENEEKVLANTTYEVRKNIALDIYDLCKQYFVLKQTDHLQFESSDTENLAIKIASQHDPMHIEELTPEFCDDIATLWATSTMKKVYEVRRKSHIMDNTPYFMDNVRRYANPEYQVTFDDYVRIRDQTTGIIHTEFTVDNGRKQWLFKIIDVGGQRTERRKWLHIFHGIDVVLYVMSLSAYDQVLYEDHTTRCYDETLNLFKKTAANKAFESTDFIVFLNKNDLFEEKIKRIPFTVYNEEFDKEKAVNPQDVVEWVQQQFVTRFDEATESMHGKNRHSAKRSGSKNGQYLDEEEEQKYNGSASKRSPPKRSGGGHGGGGRKRGLHFHLTCATSTDQIETVVKYVQIELIRKLMSRAALL